MRRMSQTTPPDLLTLYPALAGLPALVARLSPMTVPAGTRLFRENDPCQGFPLVLSRPFDKRTPSHQCGTIRIGRDNSPSRCAIRSAVAAVMASGGWQPQ